VSVDVTTDHGLVAVCSISNLSHIITLRRETWPLSVWRLAKQPFSLTVSMQVSALLSEGSPVVQVETTADGSYIVVLTKACVVITEGRGECVAGRGDGSVGSVGREKRTTFHLSVFSQLL
jgi:hypothetical protein